MVNCDGCGNEVYAFNNPCMPCIKARHRAVLNRGRCTCPKKLKRPSEVKRVYGRSWISCDRCLGQIKQLS